MINIHITLILFNIKKLSLKINIINIISFFSIIIIIIFIYISKLISIQCLDGIDVTHPHLIASSECICKDCLNDLFLNVLDLTNHIKLEKQGWDEEEPA